MLAALHQTLGSQAKAVFCRLGFNPAPGFDNDATQLRYRVKLVAVHTSSKTTMAPVAPNEPTADPIATLLCRVDASRVRHYQAMPTGVYAMPHFECQNCRGVCADCATGTSDIRSVPA